jgi:hypothetical protein
VDVPGSAAGGSGWCLLDREIDAATGVAGAALTLAVARGSSGTRGEGTGGWLKVKECREGGCR